MRPLTKALVAFGLVALLLGTELAFGDHILQAPSLKKAAGGLSLPKSGIAFLDGLVESDRKEVLRLLEIVDGSVAQLLTSMEPLVPNTPAPILRDGTPGDPRLGGFGDWHMLGDAAWQSSSAAHADGLFSLTTAGPDGRYAMAAHSFLVSPRLDLTDVPGISLDTSLQEAQIHQNFDNIREMRVGGSPFPARNELSALELCTFAAINQARGLHAATLSFQSRHGLAANRDFGRLWVYTEPPQEGLLETQARYPVPFSGLETPSAPAPVGSQTPPTAARPVAGIGGIFQQCLNAWSGPSLFNAPMSITGTQAAWRRYEVDLTPFAGRNVWLVFDVESADPGSHAGTWFTRTDNFPLGTLQPFFGWWIDRLEADAQAFPHYLRLDGFVEPSTRRNDQIVVLPGESVDPSVVVHNAGQSIENATIEFQAPGQPPLTRSLRVVPGEVATVAFPWSVPSQTQPEQPTRHRLFARVHSDTADDGPAGNRANATSEDVADLDVDALRLQDVDVFARARVPVADNGTEQTVDVEIVNRGNVPIVDGRIATRIENASAPGVPVLFFEGPADRSLDLPLEGRATRTLTVVPNLRGVFRYFVEVRNGTDAIVAVSGALLGVRVVPAILFADDYDGPPEGLGLSPELPPKIATELEGSDNGWRQADLLQGPISQTRLQGGAPPLRGSQFDPDPTHADEGRLSEANPHGVREIELTFSERIVRKDGGPKDLQVGFFLGVGVSKTKTQTVNLGGAPLFQGFGPDVTITRTVDTEAPEWARRTFDVSAALKAASRDMYEPVGNTLSMGFFAGLTWELTDIYLNATDTQTGARVVLLHNDGVHQVGHWEGWSVPLAVLPGATASPATVSPAPGGPPAAVPGRTVAPTTADPDVHLGTVEGRWDAIHYAPRNVWTRFPDVVPPSASMAWFNGNNVTFNYTRGERSRLYSPVVSFDGALTPLALVTQKFSFDDADQGRIGIQLWDDATDRFGDDLWLETVTGTSEGFDNEPSAPNCLTQVQAAQFATTTLDLTSLPQGVDVAGRMARLVFETGPANQFDVTPGPHHLPTSGRSCGWFVADVEIRGTEQFASDLRATAAEPELPYEPRLIGLGPGSTVPINVTVENAGFFPQPGFKIVAELIPKGADPRAPGHDAANFTYVDVNPLEPGENRSQVVPLAIPAIEGDFWLRVRAVSFQAEDSPKDNDCWIAFAACSPLNLPTLLAVRAYPDAAVDVDVSPKLGSPEDSRFVEILLANRGNVPLSGITVSRRIASDPEAAFPVELKAWPVPIPLAPGDAVLLSAANPAYGEDIWWKPPGTGEFDLQAQATVSDDADATDDVARVRIGVLTTAFGDGLEGVQRGRHFIGEWNTSEAWSVATGAGFESKRAYRLGSGEPLQIPAGTDAALELPGLDLSSGSSAVLSFQHRFDFENGFDGGHVEASVAGGPWQPLVPEPRPVQQGTKIVQQRYPGTLFSGNGLVPGHDPLAVVPAYTGEGTSWQPAEFQLGQIPQLIQNELFYTTSARDIAGGGALPSEEMPEEPYGRHNPDWTGATDPGWWVQEERARVVLPRGGAGDSYLWSDAFPNATRFLYETRATTDLDLTAVSVGQFVELVYYERNLSTGSIQNLIVDGKRIDGRKGVADGDGWIPVVADLTEFRGRNIELSFVYRPWYVRNDALLDDGTDDFLEMPAYNGNGGWFVDDLRVHTFRLDRGARIPVDPALRVEDFRLTPDWEFACEQVGEKKVRIGDTYWDTHPYATGQPCRPWAPSFHGASGPRSEHPYSWSIEGSGAQKQWRFFDPATHLRPVDADARLVTPPIPLDKIGGKDVSLSLTHQYGFRNCTAPVSDRPRMATEGGAVEVQEYDEVSKKWGPWQQLYDVGTSARFPAGDAVRTVAGYTQLLHGYTHEVGSSAGALFESRARGDNNLNRAFKSCTHLRFDHNGRTETQLVFAGNSTGDVVNEFDLSEFAGRTVRLGFHAHGDPMVSAPGDKRWDGAGWTIKSVEIHGDVFVGSKVRLRLRAATDEGETAGFWAVDNLAVSIREYRNNVAILLDDDAKGDLRVPAGGGTVWINGTLANLGRTPHGKLNVLTTAASGIQLRLNGGPPSPFVRDGPHDAAEAGASPDRFRFRIQAQIPAGQGDLPIRLMLLEGDGALLSSLQEIKGNEVPGNLLRDLTIHRGNVPAPLVLSRFYGSPNVVGPQQEVPLVADVRNDGVDALAVTASFTLDGASSASLPDVDFSLPPRSDCGSACRWTWQPSSEDEGRHTIGLTLTTTDQSVSRDAVVAVNTTFMFYRNGFDGPADPWTALATPAAQSPNGDRGDVTGGRVQAFPFVLSTEEPHGTTGQSWIAGVSFDQFTQGQSYPAFADGVLQSSVVDLRGVPASAKLSFWHQARFGQMLGGTAPGFRDGGVLEFCYVSGSACDPNVHGGYYAPKGGWIRLYPDGGYSGLGPSEGAQQVGRGNTFAFHGLGPQRRDCPAEGGCDLNSPTARPGVPLETGFSSDWERLTFDLSQQRFTTQTGYQTCLLSDIAFAGAATRTDRFPTGPSGLRDETVSGSCAGKPMSIVGSRVMFRFRAGSWSRPANFGFSGGQGWLVDDFQVSGYDSQIIPALQSYPLRDNTTKTFHLRVNNSGVASESFHVTADLSGLDQGFQVTLPPDFRLDPGESRVVPIQVRAPILSGIETHFLQTLRVLVSPLTDPLQATVGEIRFEFEGRTWPDYHLSQIVAEDPVRTGVPTTLSITVANAGTRNAPSVPIRLTALGPTDHEPVELAVLQTGKSLAPGASITLPFTWTPDLEADGPYLISAIANPDRAVAEIPIAPNEGTLALDVVRLLRPDLVATGLATLDQAGSGPARRLSGDLILLQGAVTNNGTGPATQARARLLIDGFTVRDILIPNLRPGESVLVDTTWPATEGHHVLGLVADVAGSDIDLKKADNAAFLEFDVARGAVGLAASPILQAGGASEVRVRNDGTAPVNLTVVLEPPLGWTAETPRDPVVLLPGEEARIEPRLTAPPGATAGSYKGRLVIRDAATDSIILEVNATFLLLGQADARLEATRAARDGPDALHVTVRNPGNAPLDAEIVVDVPGGWPDPVPRSVHVEPGRSITTRVDIEAPAAPPGAYPVQVQLRTSCCAAPSQNLEVNVPAFERLGLYAVRAGLSDDEASHAYRVVNEGNLPITAELRLENLPDGVRGHVSVPELDLQPGEARLVNVALDGDAASSESFRVVAAAGSVRATAETVLETMADDIVVSLEAPGALADGDTAELRVLVDGAPEGARVPVLFFVDDIPIAMRTSGPADEDGHAEAKILWTATAGRHLFGFQVDPHRTVLDLDRDDNIFLQEIAVGGEEGGTSPDASLAALAALLAVCILRRRRAA